MMGAKLSAFLWISGLAVKAILRLWKSLKLSQTIRAVLHRVMKVDSQPSIRS